MVKLGLSASSRGMRSRPFCVPSFNPCRLQGRYDGRLHKAGMGGAKRVPVAARAGREVARGMRKHEIAMTAGPELVDETSEVEMPDEQPHLVRLPGWAKWSALIAGIAGFGLCSVSKAYPRRKSHANSDWPPLAPDSAACSSCLEVVGYGNRPPFTKRRRRCALRSVHCPSFLAC